MASRYPSEEIDKLVASTGQLSLQTNVQPLYILGGISGSSSDEEIIAGLSQPIQSCERKYFAVTVIRDKVYVIGGRDKNGEPLNTIASFDDSGWTTLPLTLQFTRSECGVAVVNEVMYVIGGYDNSCGTAEQYDPIGNIRKNLPILGKGRWGHGVAAVNDVIYAIGGHRFKTYFNGVECYDTKLRTWKPTWKPCEGMNRRRAYFGIAAKDMFIYVFGGFGGVCNSQETSRLDIVERYDTLSDQWTLLSNLPSPRSNISACLWGTKIIVAGGYDDKKQKLNEIIEYDPLTNKWHVWSLRMRSWRFAHCCIAI